MANSRTTEVIRNLGRATWLRDGTGLTDGQLLEGYLSQRDETAFAALVRRHGPMVWGVCRRILGDHHDAEDAFQATFLVLVRKAASIVPREMLPNWLYGVAHQTAVRARALAARRKERERQVTPMPEPTVGDHDLSEDLLPLLDQELSRLPDKYRVAIVLCDLEGTTRREAARQLGCPEGTLAARVARGRMMLAKRLARRGVVLSGGVLATALARSAASASVPPSVVSATIKAASLFAAGQGAAGLISVKVAALTEGVLKTMLFTKLKVVMVLLVVAALCGAVGLLYQTQAAEPPQTPGATGNADKEKQLTAKEGEKPKAETDELQGTWKVVSREFSGQAIADVKQGQLTWVITGDKITVKGGEQPASGTLKVDQGKQPKEIDITLKEGPPSGNRTNQGIYKQEGDKLTVCFAVDGKARPTQFMTEQESFLFLVVLVRSTEEGDKAKPSGNNAPKPADPPIPGAVPFKFDQEVKIYVQSKPVKAGKDDLHIVSVGVGTFKLSKEWQLTATLKAAVLQWAKVDYRISAAVFDAEGKFLGSADHTEHVQYIRLGAIPTMLPDIKLDFGVSEAYKRAAFVVVSISEPKVPNP